MAENTTTVSGGIGLGTILFIIFLVLKLTGHITWSWFWVIFPLWIGPAVIIGILIIVLIICGIIKLIT